MKLRRTPSAKFWPKSRHLTKLHKDFPALRIALKEAKKRFGDFQGVQGFGVGKKVKGASHRIVRTRAAPGGLSIHVFVERKRTPKELARSKERLPAVLSVKVPGRKKTCRVPIDVIAIGRKMPTFHAGVESGPRRSLTQVGTPNIGRVFGITPRPGGVPGIEGGTVGAYIRGDTGQCYAVTAGHVIVDTAVPPWRVPPQGKILHLANNFRVTLPANVFYPQRLGNPPLLFDSIIFRVSPQVAPFVANCSWPSVFDGRLATEDDSALAFGEDREGSFLWVQREKSLDPSGQAAFEPWALEVNIIGKGVFKRVLPNGQEINYPELWWYRYPRYDGSETQSPWQMSIPGDSGSGLFIRAADAENVWRLLGFHIYREPDLKNRNWWGLAMPAEQYLEMIIGKHQEKWWFYGKE